MADSDVHSSKCSDPISAYDTPAGVVGSVRADRARGETAARAARARDLSKYRSRAVQQTAKNRTVLRIELGRSRSNNRTTSHQ